MTRGFDNDDYRSYEDREYHNDYYNPQHSRTHFSRPRDSFLDTDFYDGPLAIMVYIPELSTFARCEQNNQDMDFQFLW